VVGRNGVIRALPGHTVPSFVVPRVRHGRRIAGVIRLCMAEVRAIRCAIWNLPRLQWRRSSSCWDKGLYPWIELRSAVTSRNRMLALGVAWVDIDWQLSECIRNSRRRRTGGPARWVLVLVDVARGLLPLLLLEGVRYGSTVRDRHACMRIVLRLRLRLLRHRRHRLRPNLRWILMSKWSDADHFAHSSQ
jgi:hypothetical protein